MQKLVDLLNHVCFFRVINPSRSSVYHACSGALSEQSPVTWAPNRDIPVHGHPTLWIPPCQQRQFWVFLWFVRPSFAKSSPWLTWSSCLGYHYVSQGGKAKGEDILGLPLYLSGQVALDTTTMSAKLNLARQMICPYCASLCYAMI